MRTYLCATANDRHFNKSISLWFLSTPFGATFNSSCIPHTFCLSPFGWGLALPKSATNSGEEMTERKRVEERRRLFRMVLISFLDGHQVPAAIRDSFPGFTSVRRRKNQNGKRETKTVRGYSLILMKKASFLSWSSKPRRRVKLTHGL